MYLTCLLGFPLVVFLAEKTNNLVEFDQLLQRQLLVLPRRKPNLFFFPMFWLIPSNSIEDIPKCSKHRLCLLYVHRCFRILSHLHHVTFKSLKGPFY